MPKRDGTPTKREFAAKLKMATLEDRAQMERERRAKREAERAELERLKREAEAERIAERAALEEARRDTLLRDGPDAVLKMPASRVTRGVLSADDENAGTRAREHRNSCQTPAGARNSKSLPPNASDFRVSAGVVGDSSDADDARVTLVEVSSGSDAGDIRWAMENLHAGNVGRGDAPSLTAWALLCWARRDAKSMDSFVTQVYGKAFVSKDEEDSKRRDRRSRANVESMIARCLEAATDQNGTALQA